MAERKVTPTGVLAAPAALPQEQWLALRRTGIGGSDIAAILGMSGYTSPYEVYLDKRGEFPEQPRPPRLDQAARWGHLHEPLIAAEFARIHKVRTRRVGLIRHRLHSWRLASLDYKVLGCRRGACLLEIKNRSAWKASEWGDSGDPHGVPDIEALQTHWYLTVTGYAHAHVAVLINGNDDRYYTIDYDPGLALEIVAIASEFWDRVLDGSPPPMTGTDAEARFLSGLWPAASSSEITLPPASPADSLLLRRSEMQEQITDRMRRKTACEDELKVLLGDADTAVRDGRPVVSWKRNGPFSARRFRDDCPDLYRQYLRMEPALDTAALAADHPDLYRQYRARVLRVHQETP